MKLSSSSRKGNTIASNTAFWKVSFSKLLSRTSKGHSKHRLTTSPYLSPRSISMYCTRREAVFQFVMASFTAASSAVRKFEILCPKQSLWRFLESATLQHNGQWSTLGAQHGTRGQTRINQGLECVRILLRIAPTSWEVVRKIQNTTYSMRVIPSDASTGQRICREWGWLLSTSVPGLTFADGISQHR